MKATLPSSNPFKPESVFLPLWLTSFALLLLETDSLFLVVPLFIGTSLATLPILFHGKIALRLRYLIPFGFFVIENLFPDTKLIHLSLTLLFLPLFFVSEETEEPPYAKLAFICFFAFLLYLNGMEIVRIFLFSSLSLLSIHINSLNAERKRLKKNYNDYYYLTKSEKNELKTLYEKLSLEQNHNIENAILNERNRLSRDIHDSMGHLTSRGILQIGAMLVTEKDEAKKEALLSLKNTLSEGMNEVRKSLHGFQNEAIILKEEMKKIVDAFTFCEVDFTFSSGFDFSLKEKYSILFILKEALTNINRHSSATKASVSFIETEEKVYLKITDNGKNAKIKTDGMGLYSIRKRAEDLGGSAEFSVDKGFRIFITLKKRGKS